MHVYSSLVGKVQNTPLTRMSMYFKRLIYGSAMFRSLRFRDKYVYCVHLLKLFKIPFFPLYNDFMYYFLVLFSDVRLTNRCWQYYYMAPCSQILTQSIFTHQEHLSVSLIVWVHILEANWNFFYFVMIEVTLCMHISEWLSIINKLVLLLSILKWNCGHVTKAEQ